MSDMRLAVSGFELTPRFMSRAPFACLRDPKDDGLLALFGPLEDMKSRYVAQTCAEARLLGGDFGRWVPSSQFEPGPVVAVLDERSRPWVLCGRQGDPDSERDARLLRDSAVFHTAVLYARQNELVADQDAAIYPAHVGAILGSGGGATAGQRAVVENWVDRHWADGLT